MCLAEASLERSLNRLRTSPVLPLLERLSAFFAARRLTAYVVGGFLRDTLLERDTGDIDIAVDSDACRVARQVVESFGGSYVLLDEVNRIARVIIAADAKRQSWTIDFSTVERDIQQDLARRDFAVNAMALDLADFIGEPARARLIDPFGGAADLQSRQVRAIADDIFQQDPVRLMRAVRLAAELDFTIEDGTASLIARDACLVSSAAGERLREELLKLLAVRGAGGRLAYMNRTGLLTALFPELEPARETTQPKEHHWKVLDHSINTVSAVEFLLREGEWQYTGTGILDSVPWSERLANHFNTAVSHGSTHRTLLKLAALLHDIAKPQTKALQPSGRIRFLGHAEIGAATVAAILARLRFSGRETRLVETMVKQHLRPGQLSQGGLPTRRAIYRYFRDAGSAGIDTLFLSLADHLAARGPDLDTAHWRLHSGQVGYVLEQYFAQQAAEPPRRLVDGHDLMSIFGLKPGPRLKEILEAVREAQATGDIGTREEALAYVKQHLLTEAEREVYGTKK